jgi:hypothetical protein
MLDPNALILGRSLDSADDSSILSGIRTTGFHQREVILTRETTMGVGRCKMALESSEGQLRENRSIVGPPAYRHAMEKLTRVKKQFNAAWTLDRLGRIVADKEDHFGRMTGNDPKVYDSLGRCLLE